MKLNANDFRKSLEEKKKQKKAGDISLLRMQQDLQASIERRAEYLKNIGFLALEAALNGQKEVGLDIDTRTEYENYLRNYGFEIESREIQSDSLLRKIRKLAPRELKSLLFLLKSELAKIEKILPPEDVDLTSEYEYQALLHASDDVENQVKYLLIVLARYNIEYRENNYLSLEEDAKLWLHLSRLQDVIDFYDAENPTEESIQAYLKWENDAYDTEDFPDESSPYSLLNPKKLRFINSKEGDEFFQKISSEINDRTDELKSFIQFDLIVEENGRQIIFSDETSIDVPFCANDLYHIFKKMGFNASCKARAIRGQDVTAFKIKF